MQRLRRLIKRLLNRSRSDGPPAQPKGGLDLRADRSTIVGWAALAGDTRPREVTLKVGDTLTRLVASEFHEGNAKHGTAAGPHGFTMNVPQSAKTGQSVPVVLADAQTGTVLARRKISWPADADFHDFESFLKSSMTQVVVRSPFRSVDKQCFATMENIASRLCRAEAELTRKPLISIVMPAYNRAGLVLTAIRSVLAQTYTHFELIVVDDGSTDDTAAVVASVADPRVRLIRLAANMGHAAARNKALEASSGEIIAYLDSDNFWDERYLSATVGAFATLPDAELLYSGVYNYRTNSDLPTAIRYAHFNRALLENRNIIDLNCMAHRRQALDRTGMFNTALRRYVDYDLALRMTEVCKTYSIPVLLVHYRFDAAEMTVTKDATLEPDREIVIRDLNDRAARRLAERAVPDLTRDVTVVIPNWQSAEDIRDCLGAVHAHDWKGRLQVVVVDNASDHDVVVFLQEEQKAGRIRLIENRKNYGFTYAANQGISASAPGSDIVLLNNDAILQSDAIPALQKACYRLPEAGMTVPRQILPAGTPTMRVHVPSAKIDWPCDANLSAHHNNIAQLPLFHDGGPVELTYAPFFAVYIRRDVIDVIGLLDAEHGRHYRSDKLYCALMRVVTGRRIYYVPDARAVHRLQAATQTLRQDEDRQEEFDLMFRQNRWDEQTRKELGFRLRKWDEP